MNWGIFLSGTLLAFGLLAGAMPSPGAPSAPGADPDLVRADSAPVVLLHGLALPASSMQKLANGLRNAGFRPCLIDYPSQDHPIDTLALRFVLPEIHRCFPGDTAPIHFVTHSLGGILARRLALAEDAPRFGRVVMIAVPNHGSEIVDRLGHLWLFAAWNGPAGRQLGTDSASVPRRLGPALFEAGVIAGNRSLEFLFSDWLPGSDDGTVSVASTKLEGMRDFIEIPASHTFILWKDETVRQTVHFLREGRFYREE